MKVALIFTLVIGVSLARQLDGKVTPRGLPEEFDELVKLLPLEKMEQILRDDLKTNGELQRVVRYLQGEQWASIIAAIASNENFQELETYLIDAGIPVKELVGQVHDLIASLEPGEEGTEDGGTLRSFLDEEIDTLPLTELIIWLTKEMTTSKDFQALYVKVSSEKTHQLFETVRHLPEVQRLAEELLGMGVDVEAIMIVIYAFLGWEWVPTV